MKGDEPFVLFAHHRAPYHMPSDKSCPTKSTFFACYGSNLLESPRRPSDYRVGHGTSDSSQSASKPRAQNQAGSGGTVFPSAARADDAAARAAPGEEVSQLPQAGARAGGLREDDPARYRIHALPAGLADRIRPAAFRFRLHRTGHKFSRAFRSPREKSSRFSSPRKRCSNIATRPLQRRSGRLFKKSATA